MATITTFSSLKSAAADWLDRSDISDVGGPLDTMIEMAEDQIYRELRMRFMEAATTETIASGVINLPASWLETKQAHISSSSASYKLEPRSAEWIYAYFPDRSSTGLPKYIGQEGETFIFGPYPDSAYSVVLQYYARPTSLSTSNESNWLTTNASDVLLNAVLLQSVSYLGMDERAEYWKKYYEDGLRNLMKQQQRERYGAEQSLRVRVA